MLMIEEAPAVNIGTEHFRHKTPIKCPCLTYILSIFFGVICLEILVLGIFLKVIVLIYVGVSVLVFFAVLIYCMNQNLKRYVIDIDVSKSEMVIEHCRLPIYCYCNHCLDNKEKCTISPLSDVISFSYSPYLSGSDLSTFTVSTRNGVVYASEFSMPVELIWRMETILKLINPALRNSEIVGESTTFNTVANEPNYSTYTGQNIPTNNIPLNAPAAYIANRSIINPVSSNPATITSTQLGIIINQLQGQQALLQQQEEQRQGHNSGFPPPNNDYETVTSLGK